MFQIKLMLIKVIRHIVQNINTEIFWSEIHSFPHLDLYFLFLFGFELGSVTFESSQQNIQPPNQPNIGTPIPPFYYYNQVYIFITYANCLSYYHTVQIELTLLYF